MQERCISSFFLFLSKLLTKEKLAKIIRAKTSVRFCNTFLEKSVAALGGNKESTVPDAKSSDGDIVWFQSEYLEFQMEDCNLQKDQTLSKYTGNLAEKRVA